MERPNLPEELMNVWKEKDAELQIVFDKLDSKVIFQPPQFKLKYAQLKELRQKLLAHKMVDDKSVLEHADMMEDLFDLIEDLHRYVS